MKKRSYLKEFKYSSQNRLFIEIGLFGSYARNQADDFSDIDVAVKVNKSYLKQHDVWDYFDAISEMKMALLTCWKNKKGYYLCLRLMVEQNSLIKGAYDMRNYIVHDYEGKHQVNPTK